MWSEVVPGKTNVKLPCHGDGLERRSNPAWGAVTSAVHVPSEIVPVIWLTSPSRVRFTVSGVLPGRRIVLLAVLFVSNCELKP